MTVTVYDAPLAKSQNLRGLLTYYRAHPDDIVVKVEEGYKVMFFFSHDGAQCQTNWADWRVLLDWIRTRRTWSVNRVTFDAPLYDQIDATEFASFRKSGILLTRHAYLG